LTVLYEGLKDAEVVWDEKTQSYTSGSDYMDRIHIANQRAEAAWRATGIPALMSERNVNAGKWGYLEHSIFGSISIELEDQQWKDIVAGLQSAETSSDYKQAVELITPYINKGIKASRIRTTTSEKDVIRSAVIERISRYKDDDTTTPRDDGNGEVAGEENLSSSLIFGDALKRIATDITKDDIGAVKRLGPRPEPTGRIQSTDFRQNPSYIWNAKVEAAQNRDPEYLLPLLKKERDKLENIDSRTPGGAYWILDRLGRIKELIKKFEVMLDLPLSDPDQGQDPVSSLTQPRGMMNQGPGMIFEAEQSMAAPDVNARWSPA